MAEREPVPMDTCVRSNCRHPESKHKFGHYRQDGHYEQRGAYFCTVPGCPCLGYWTEAQDRESMRQVAEYEAGGWPRGNPF
jgi:hypothetical protein